MSTVPFTAPDPDRVASNRAFLARYGNSPTVALGYIGRSLIDAAAAGPLAPDVADALAMYTAWSANLGGTR
ncbi:hypothetical protein AWW66_10905 [Micromonospora rosaria]|uniref:Uncharacterized protein n=1 Tax=Micromonospora rosaria TaxID=47874 RepID=A0A136PU45_9ACTN|nr:hypothetical protein [Micromonospora rosaria]KXK61942.1 hypothetical protein AWW66_10905 [Micromonospora rosaria]